MKNYIKATDTQLTTYEEITKSLINTIEQKNAVIEALQKNVDALSASVVKTNKFVENEIFNELNSTKKAVDAILNENISDIKCEVEKILEELNDKSYDINEKVCNFKKKLRDTENKLNLVERETILTNSRLRRIERNLRNENYPIKEPTLEFQRKEKLDIDYLLFNERFGGSIKEIEDKFSQYISYFINKKNVLDIGCGRGVFLQLLTDNGVDCKGIDLDDDMILHCKEKGFNVEKVDAFSYLNSIDDNSLGGVFLGQVIEHMTPGEVLKLIRLSYQKLQPGAYFIAETINPQSLYVFTTSYLLDPSHIRMIHPETLKFMLETEGYNEVEVKYLSEVEEHLKIPKLEGNTENIKQFNESMEKLNNLIFGFRDYAVIGKR
jgi:O-antigen chain-terminating methyltransferase